MDHDLLTLFNKMDSITYNHSVRVMRLAREVEEYYNLGDTLLSEAALLHDIGKIYVSSKILDKISRLSDLERILVNLHPYIGYRILKEFDLPEDICRIVLYHHGINPPVLEVLPEFDDNRIFDRALMLHSIDSFEALTSDRPYHRGFLASEALDIMLREKNHHQAVLDFLIMQMESDESDRESVVFRHKSNSNSVMIDSIFNKLVYRKDPGEVAVAI